MADIYLYPRQYPQNHRGLPQHKRAEIVQLLFLGWKPDCIAKTVQVSQSTVERIEKNLAKYGTVTQPHCCRLGRPKRLTEADKEAVFSMLLEEGWRQQEEIVYFLKHERGIEVHRSTVSRLLKHEKWSQKELQRISRLRSEELREGWRNDIGRFAQEDLIFLDESIFNKKTGWRHRAYAPIGSEARYITSIERGKT